MHERISINALCFLGAPLSEMAGSWRELHPRRVSFISDLVTDVESAAAVVCDGGYEVDLHLA